MLSLRNYEYIVTFFELLSTPMGVDYVVIGFDM